MSIVHEPGFCYCSCHESAGVMHSVPCCDGKCPHCARHVERFGMDEHIRVAHPWITEGKSSGR